MSILGPDDAFVFRCPQCSEFISSTVEVCRFCDTPITAEMKEAGAAATYNENRKYRRGFYAKILFMGIGLFAGGAALIALFVISLINTGEGTFFYVGPILTAWGVGQIILGLHGIYKERR